MRREMQPWWVGFLCCSLAIGSAIFLIVELDNPFGGIVRISSGPVGDFFGPYVARGDMRFPAWTSITGNGLVPVSWGHMSHRSDYANLNRTCAKA